MEQQRKGSTLLVLFILGLTMMASGQTSDASDAVSAANTLFTSDFYAVLKTQTPDQNVIFSPYSLSACIAMLKAGAQGATAAEIQRGMHYPADDVLFQGYENQLMQLKSNENFTLETANSVYTKAGFKLSPRYESIVQKHFGARVRQLDFSDGAGSAKEINGFVERVTHDKIKDLIHPDDLNQNTRLVLVNAIYFKGLWKNKFDEQATIREPFHVSPGSDVIVNMMKITADFPYGEIKELDAKAISLPYKGDRLSMIVILPNAQDGLADLESKLKTFNLGTIQSYLTERKVRLSMPRFKLESEIDLQGPLDALGMKLMFDEQKADLGGIPDHSNVEPLYVSKAVQKAFLEVNEEGSKAAAVTAAGIQLKTALLERAKIITFDHPFIAFIQDSTYFLQSSPPNLTNVVAAPAGDRSRHRHRANQNTIAQSGTGTGKHSNILFMSSLNDPSSEISDFTTFIQIPEVEAEAPESDFSDSNGRTLTAAMKMTFVPILIVSLVL